MFLITFNVQVSAQLSIPVDDDGGKLSKVNSLKQMQNYNYYDRPD